MNGNMNKKIIPAALAAVMLFSLASCKTEAPAQSVTTAGTAAVTESVPREMRRIIIDTDTGADDASAMILAAKDEYTEILGITVLVGNVDLEQGTKNALMALEIAGDRVPVYKGADKSINGEKKVAFSVFGNDGMGDAGLVHPKGKAEEGDAVDFIINTVKSSPGEVEIVAIGPATNIANAVLKDHEAMKQVKMIWCMGTTGLGPGNASPVAEFNVYKDAEAYKIMLDAGLPITIVGYDMCNGDALWYDEQFKTLGGANDIGEFVSKSFGKIREFYRKNGSDGVNNCDAVAMMCALQPDFVTSMINCHASCITEKGETYGEVIFYKEGFTYDIVDNDMTYNVRLVTGVRGGEFFDRYLDAIK